MAGSTRTRNLVIGLSGPSSSGKTSLAFLLRDILNGLEVTGDPLEYPRNGKAKGQSGLWTGVRHRHGSKFRIRIRVEATVLHEDDFYKVAEE